ncbi:MAG: vitamin B12-dependent ribonucleotide reductase [Clostridia bacterium]|nr:vitamin B12-dependent ribonucleotide reductase [Clostridia bacterium]MBN2883229.1 vitamin B12-dependent ribonucleotide reductase [Clostridia bacterium]
MAISENAVKVLEKRYLARDEAGNLVETPEEMFRRVAHAVAEADLKYFTEEEVSRTETEFYHMMSSLEFLPNSPTLMNAGRPLGQLSACFVLPIDDSMEAIFEAIKNAALIHKSGGGTGFSFSKIRPAGSVVRTTGGVASGPISFMKVFNSATEAVKQGGTRRGANMGILRVDHPDIREFITCKQDNKEITNFNISIGVTEDFMEAVENNAEYELIHPKSKRVVKKESAREIFDMIVTNAWNNGEPGIIFLDRINRTNTVPGAGDIESTNPCGEQPLLPYESCNLGSINLMEMMNESGTSFNYEKLRETIRKAVHFLDNVIDVSVYPHPMITERTKATRKIGLGVMGWADALYKMGIAYNSMEALELGRSLMKFLDGESKKASMNLAQIKGVFPYYDMSIFKDRDILIRNATTTTIAPTGTLSIIAGVSSGVEPVFGLSYIRNIMDDEEMVEGNAIFEKHLVDNNAYSQELMKEIALSGTIAGIDEIDEETKRIFVTAHDISPEWHIKMQAVFQEYTDNAVSKTVNLRKEATKEDVSEVFLKAYSLGCKGVTLYRDGSRDYQVLNIGGVNRALLTGEKLKPRERPEVTTGFTQKVKIGCGNLYITVNYDENGKICEVFTNTGRNGGCPSQSEATSRLVSIALRSGVDTKAIVEQLKGIRCPSTIRQKDLKVLSCPDAIGRLIEKVDQMNHRELPEEVIEGNPEIESTMTVGGNMVLCPECGHSVEHEGGCVICRNCGYSKCG